MFRKSRHGAVTVISAEGPLTHEEIDSTAEILEECLGDGQPQAVLDLARVQLMDGASLELLLTVQETFERQGGALKLAAPNPLCLDALTVTGVSDYLEVFDETAAAVRSFMR